jgi:hypothetical protein
MDRGVTGVGYGTADQDEQLGTRLRVGIRRIRHATLLVKQACKEEAGVDPETAALQVLHVLHGACGSGDEGST